MLMDALVPALYWVDAILMPQMSGDLVNRTQLALTAVHMGDKAFLDHRHKSLCHMCVAYSSRVMATYTTGVAPVTAAPLNESDARAQIVFKGRSVVAFEPLRLGASIEVPKVANETSGTELHNRSASKDEAHCFCGGAVFASHRLPAFSKERQQGILAFRSRLITAYNEPPYGVVPSRENYTRLGYWVNGSEDAPRLLLVNRNRRRVANIPEIETLARLIGFNVVTVYFERLSHDVQFHLSRHADVLVAIHGMALTFVANMDGGLGSAPPPAAPQASCKTLVELMHWVLPGPFYIYREMAELSGVGFAQLLPKTVVFGPSVTNPALERRELQKPGFGWWARKGFDDQTVTFDMRQLKLVLQAALKRAQRCTRS